MSIRRTHGRGKRYASILDTVGDTPDRCFTFPLVVCDAFCTESLVDAWFCNGSELLK